MKLYNNFRFSKHINMNHCKKISSFTPKFLTTQKFAQSHLVLLLAGS